MRTLYLLPFDDAAIQYSFNKKDIEKLLSSSDGFPYHGILEVEIDNLLADQLPTTPPSLKGPYSRNISSKYFDDKSNFLDKQTSRYKKNELRIYIIFDKTGKCYWCSSGNNLDYHYKNLPDKYFGPPIRVALTQSAWIRLYGYSEWACDNY